MIHKFLISSVSLVSLAIATPLCAQEAATASPPAPTMDFGEWGVGLDEIDHDVEPGDDFNAYVNGKWIAENEIPADRSSFGAFNVLREKSVADVEALISELSEANPAAGSNGRRIIDSYSAFLDVEAINASGLAPAQPYLNSIFTAPDLAALVTLFQQPGYPALVGAGVGVDSKDPDTHIVSVGFSGMGLPDRDYYLVDSERNLEIRAGYLEFLTFALGQAGYQDPANAAKAVYAFEHKVAVLEWDRRMLRIPDLTYNKLTRAELLALTPDFPLMELLVSAQFADETHFEAAQLLPTPEEIEELGLGEEQLAMMGGGLPAMMELLNETPLSTLKAYMAAQFLRGNAPFLSTELDEASFALFGTLLSGQEQQRPRWKRAIGVAESQLGEQLGALYVERNFPPEAKAQMDELVANLRLSLKASLGENEWLSEATTEQALAKLDAFTPMIGYPEEFESYDGLEIRPDDPLGNRIRTIAWAIEDARKDLDGPVDRSQWGMLPQTVNAYYSPNFNQIVFPAAILQAPFFDPNADPAVNYGAIGAVIGHEIGHGFDDQGSRYDGTGALANWWQDEDRAGFEERADRLKALIAQYCPLEEDGEKLCLRGEQAIGETLGDVVGLQMSYRAYRVSLGGQEAPVIDGLTGDQRFFLGFAQVWRAKMREEALRSRLITANHPPSEFRTNNTVRNHDAWYEAFNVGPEHKLYLPPEERVKIW